MRYGPIACGMFSEEGGQPNGLSAEFLADELLAVGGFVPFVKQEIERLKNAIQPGRQLLAHRDLKGDTCVLEPLFCSSQAFRDRLIGRQEGCSDLLGAESAQRLQR